MKYRKIAISLVVIELLLTLSVLASTPTLKDFCLLLFTWSATFFVMAGLIPNVGLEDEDSDGHLGTAMDLFAFAESQSRTEVLGKPSLLD